MTAASSGPSAILYALERRTALGPDAAARAHPWWAERPELRLTFPEGPISMVMEVVRFWREERADLLSKEEDASTLREENDRLRAELDAWDRSRSQGADLIEMVLDAGNVGVRLSTGELFEMLQAWRSE
ncbi:MAG: hypothetical protein M1606_00135 [Candidatus Thermoplasmatota archaeon]|jgi:hypothetical protein|nr:hypothetical protein [Candidatus Thermoplasmatota archaeon]MCL5983064.1 hypothetical protein [Candidatus Thermoplasmatota archaeon]